MSQLAEITFIGLVGASGVGKNAIAQAMTTADSRFSKITSSTTRRPIPERGEVQGNPYNFSTDEEQAIITLEEDITSGEIVQVAAHPTMPVYYYSSIDQWTKTPYVTMDVLTGAYSKISRELPLLGCMAIVVVAETDEYLERFYMHNEGETADNTKKRLTEAVGVYDWALKQGEAVAWLSNQTGQLETAGKFALDIATGERVYSLSDASKKQGELLLEQIKREVKN